MSQRILLGMLTPSSNTVLEPVTTQMIAGLPEASAHFGRFRVTEIALSEQALGQFDDSEILRAAELLSHAKVNVIGWNGTSSGWLGFDADERLCSRISEATGIPACTSVLALNEIFRLTGVERFGLVTPYGEAAGDHGLLHRTARGAAGRSARARARHSDPRHDSDRRVEVVEARRCRPQAHPRMGPAVPGSRVESAPDAAKCCARE